MRRERREEKRREEKRKRERERITDIRCGQEVRRAPNSKLNPEPRGPEGHEARGQCVKVEARHWRLAAPLFCGVGGVA